MTMTIIMTVVVTLLVRWLLVCVVVPELRRKGRRWWRRHTRLFRTRKQVVFNRGKDRGKPQREVPVGQVPELKQQPEWERVVSSILDDDDEPYEYNVTVYPADGNVKTGDGVQVSRLSDSRP